MTGRRKRQILTALLFLIIALVIAWPCFAHHFLGPNGLWQGLAIFVLGPNWFWQGLIILGVGVWLFCGLQIILLIILIVMFFVIRKQ